MGTRKEICIANLWLINLKPLKWKTLHRARPLSDQPMGRCPAALRPPPLAPSGLSVFVIVSRCRPDGQLLQPSGQPFELLVCAEFVQAVNADLNRLGVVLGDTVNVFGVTHDRLRPLRCQLNFSDSDGDRVGPHRDGMKRDQGPPEEGPGSRSARFFRRPRRRWAAQWCA